MTDRASKPGREAVELASTRGDVVAVTLEVAVIGRGTVAVTVAVRLKLGEAAAVAVEVEVPVTDTDDVATPDPSASAVEPTSGVSAMAGADVALGKNPDGRAAIAANTVGDRTGSVVDATVDADALGGSGAVATEATVANGAGTVVPATVVDVTAGMVATVPDASATGGGMTLTSRKPFAIRKTDNAARRTISMVRRPTRFRPIFMMRCHPYAHRQFRTSLLKQNTYY